MNSFNDLKIPSSKECLYTSCYCEENVWKLCEYVKNNQSNLLSNCYAVFISNRNQTVPLWYQKSGKDENKLAVWDYHVIFIYHSNDDKGALVYDLDTVLPFPVPLEKYAPLTFQFETYLQPIHHRCFRVIPAELFLKTFASDRSRMKSSDGSWIKEPPPYPCLSTSDSTNNIDDFISMDPTFGIGEVMNLNQFLEKFL
ncbi:protein N-terminal glutamine amidohydrolase [Trichonephila inaurata madagascariensis]|uniref:Protein N-terminal glutamine amidohydrolase n=1 Tax=Trichonephila inaurata madagascariensis TaxID=2747483 RepID=A0A8X6WW80_9ARAC|nr:protein N-terminal glutamine amidohydrolase [Trichonephila inaurata madagascariensis]